MKKKIFIIVTTILLIIINGFYIEAITDSSEKKLVLDENIIQNAWNRNVDMSTIEPYVLTTSNYKEVTEDIEKGESTKQEAAVNEYKILPEFYSLIEEIVLPCNSQKLKQKMLQFLENKILIHQFTQDDIALDSPQTSVFIVGDPTTKKIYGFISNVENVNTAISLVVQNEHNQSTTMKLVSMKQIVTEYQEGISKEDVLVLQDDATVEVEITNVINAESEEEALTYDIHKIETTTSTAEKEQITLAKNSIYISELSYHFDALEKESRPKGTETTTPIEERALFAEGPDINDEFDTPPSLAGTKKATPVPGEEGLFKVELEVSGKEGSGSISEPAAADVVVVLDLSFSMDQDYQGKGKTSWQYARQSLATLSRILLHDQNVDAEVAIVGFGTQVNASAAHEVFCGFTSDPDQFDSSYNYGTAAQMRNSGKIKFNFGTNIHAGFIGAQELLATRENNGRNKYIIFVSDGHPSAYYTKTTKPYQEYYGNEKEEFYTAPVEVAKQLQSKGDIVYAIGIELKESEKIQKMFKGLAGDTGKFLLTDNAKLEESFKAIATEIQKIPIKKPNGETKLTDNLSEYVELVPNHNGETMQDLYSKNNGATWLSYEKTDISYTKDANGSEKLVWKVPDFNENYVYKITYFVRLKETYYGMKIHKNGANGENPQVFPNGQGDGVVANGATYIESKNTPRTDIAVPTVYTDKAQTVPATIKGDKRAVLIDGDKAAGKYRITVTFEGEDGYKVGNGITTPMEHQYLNLIDPMSEYVEYQNNVVLESALKGTSSWQICTEGKLEEKNNTLNWRIPNSGDMNTKQYRISYNVQVKDVYAGEKWHKDQISGENPPKSPSGEAVGLLANKKTYVYSNQVSMEEIMVPAIYRAEQNIKPGEITDNKSATAIPVTDPGYKPGLFEIGILISGKPKEITEDGNTTYEYHHDIEVFDPMSKYVDFIDKTLKLEQADTSTSNWETVQTQNTLKYDSVTKKIYCAIPNPEKGKQYRISYRIQVKDEYKDLKIHKDHSSGRNPVDLPNGQGDGVLANGYTYVKSSLVKEQEIMVPTVYFESPMVVSVLKKVANQGSLPIDNYIFKLTGPNNYEEMVSIPARLFHNGEATAVQFSAPAGGFVHGEYTLKEIFGTNSKYQTSKIRVIEDGVEKSVNTDTSEAILTLNPGDKDIVAEVTNTPKRSTATTPDFKVTKKVTNTSKDGKTFNIKLIPSDKKLQKDYSVLVPVTIKGDSATVSGVEGILFNTTYYMEEQDSDDYFVTYYTKIGNNPIIKDKFFQITDKNTAIELIVENDPKPPVTPFNFTKIGGNDTSNTLAGAKFQLYVCQHNHESDHAHEPVVTEEIINDGHCWIPFRLEMFVSNNNGYVDFGSLSDGQYMLVEKEAPSGYEVPVGQWIITIDSTKNEDQKIDITSAAGLPQPPAFIKDTTKNKLYLPNIPKMQLPNSGGSGIYPFIVVGMGAIVVASLMLLYCYKKKNRKVS